MSCKQMTMACAACFMMIVGQIPGYCHVLRADLNNGDASIRLQDLDELQAVDPKSDGQVTLEVGLVRLSSISRVVQLDDSSLKAGINRGISHDSKIRDNILRLRLLQEKLVDVSENLSSVTLSGGCNLPQLVALGEGSLNLQGSVLDVL
jgi:hypothetical protein